MSVDNIRKREQEIVKSYEILKPRLQEFGDFVDSYLMDLLNENEFRIERIQIPPKNRLKANHSLIGRALYRDIDSRDPLKRIEDKIATRIVVTSLEDVDKITEIIMASTKVWSPRISRGRDKHLINPKEFDYKAVHINLLPNQECSIFEGLQKNERQYYVCEVQIRTLLQHAFAEVAHDTIYKGPYSRESELVRILSRGQALMEITDEYFLRAYEMTRDDEIYEKAFLRKLIEIGNQLAENNLFNIKEIDQNFTRDIFDEYSIQKVEISSVERTLKINSSTINSILTGEIAYFYKQPASLFLMYKIFTNLLEVREKWKFDADILEDILFNLGYSMRR